jgi:HlyD family secretion protein
VTIRSPIDGQILRILEQSEGIVAAGDSLVEIGDSRDLEIIVDLLSADAVKVEPGQRVFIDRWGGDTVLEGRVSVVEPFGFTKISALGIEEQRVNVIIDLTSPMDDWAKLAHGYQVDAQIVLWEQENTLTVPLLALFRDGEQWAVFVESQGRARLRPVSIGRRSSLDAEILDGLDEGDRVILHPSDRVQHGVRVSDRG